MEKTLVTQLQEEAKKYAELPEVFSQIERMAIRGEYYTTFPNKPSTLLSLLGYNISVLKQNTPESIMDPPCYMVSWENGGDIPFGTTVSTKWVAPSWYKKKNKTFKMKTADDMKTVTMFYTIVRNYVAAFVNEATNKAEIGEFKYSEKIPKSIDLTKLKNFLDAKYFSEGFSIHQEGEDHILQLDWSEEEEEFL